MSISTTARCAGWLAAAMVLGAMGCRTAPDLASIRYGKTPETGGAALAAAASGPAASLANSPPPDPTAPQTTAGGRFVQTPNGLRYEPTTDEELLSKPKPGVKDRAKKAWQTATLSSPDRIKAEKLYEEGERLFAEKSYNAAARKFRQAARRWPDSALQEDSMFMRAESLFFTDRYAKADDTWGEMLRKYENSRHLDKVVARQFSIARYWEESHKAKPHWILTPNFFDKTRPMFDTPGNALATYDSIRINDPTGPLADDAIMATANAHFLNERYDDADYYYSLLRSDYSQSEHQTAAHSIGLQAKMLAYQGSMYDAKPLDEADELVQQTSVQFATQSSEERDRLARAQQVIKDQQAQRDWDAALYYENRREYGSARYYYERVARQHPDSRYAAMVADKIGDIKDLPATPPERLNWLANLFPGERRKSLERAANSRPLTKPEKDGPLIAGRPDREGSLR